MSTEKAALPRGPSQFYRLSMRAPGPAAWTAHTLAHLIEADGNTTFSRLVLLGGGNPADPLVPGEGSDIRPYILRFLIARDRLAKICWHFVHGAMCDGGHVGILHEYIR